jgi:glyoxylase-like metal-dependent hydrolase (beta-lactamase superfamily II)
MEPGDVRTVTTGDCTDLYYVDTGMYDTAEYGAVYVLDAERPAIVDTGIGANYEYVLDALDEAGIAPEDLEVIAVTHVHLDHAGGAGYLAEACPNAAVYVHESGARHLTDPSRLWEGTRGAVGDQIDFYAEPKPVPEERVTELTDGDVIDLGDHELVARHAPGHAPHQVILEDPANDAVFTADAAGIWVPSRDRIRETSPPPQFDLEGALADAEMLVDLDRETLLYAHFGPKDADGVLTEYTDVLTDWVRAVERVRDELGDDEAVIDHFVAENETEDVWGERKARGETAMNVRGVIRYLDGRE